MRDHDMESDSEFSGAEMMAAAGRGGVRGESKRSENGSGSDHVLHLLHQLATCG